MKYLCLFVIILSPLVHFTTVYKSLAKAKSYNEIQEKIEKEFAAETTYYGYIDRQLTPDFREVKTLFTINKTQDYYELNMLLKGENIVAAKLNHHKNEKFWIKNKKEVVLFIEQHNSLHSSNKRIKDVEKELFDFHLFSSACGFDGEASIEWRQMEEAVNTYNYSKLKQLLSSLKIEKQTYGLIGLLKLQAAGGTIKAEDKKIIDQLLIQNPIIETCMGCIPGEQFPLQELISFYIR